MFQRLVASGFIEPVDAAPYLTGNACGSPMPAYLDDNTFLTYLVCVVVAAKVHGARVGNFCVRHSVQRALRALGATTLDADLAWSLVLDREYTVLDALEWRVAE